MTSSNQGRVCRLSNYLWPHPGVCRLSNRLLVRVSEWTGVAISCYEQLLVVAPRGMPVEQLLVAAPRGMPVDQLLVVAPRGMPVKQLLVAAPRTPRYAG